MIKPYLCFFSLVILGVILFSQSTESIAQVSPNMPSGSPFLAPYIITATYHDPIYYTIFHKQHTGVDLIPAKRSANQTIIYATLSGTGYRYSDPCSGLAAIIVGNNFITYYGHVASFLFSNDTSIHKFQPIAIMGESGEKGVCVTGPHVHYQIFEKEHGVFIIVNPLPFLSP